MGASSDILFPAEQQVELAESLVNAGKHKFSVLELKSLGYSRQNLKFAVNVHLSPFHLTSTP